MSGKRMKRLRDLFRAFVTGDTRLQAGGAAGKKIRKRMWACMKQAYRPGMSNEEILTEALKL